MRFMRIVLLFAAVVLLTGLRAGIDYGGFRAKVRSDHPRLFLTAAEVPLLRSRAQGACREEFERLMERVERYPDEPKLELREDLAEIRDGILHFRRNINDQNAAAYVFRGTGGREALECAIAHLVTGEEKYRRRALKFLDLNRQFFQLADRSKVMPEWFHRGRLAAIVAWDWLYDGMTEEERRGYMAPLLAHVEYMQTAPYPRDMGGEQSGNYGEPALQYFAGLAAAGSGIDDAAAERLLSRGFALHVRMMDFRDRVSDGSGLFASISTAYSFAAYPWATFNFLHTLRSAAGIDGTVFWNQMRDYPEFFRRLMIPDPSLPCGFADHGWGDSGHTTGAVNNRYCFTHMAQIIHFYGAKHPETAAKARALQEMLPEKLRVFCGVDEYPFTPYILTGFDPAVRNALPPEKVFSADAAAHFPSYGLTVMSSGVGAGDTYASFKGGAKYVTHQHYDENTFVIFRSGFLAPDTGMRGSAAHHKVYYPQTVAHNGILIRMEKEVLPDFWYPANAPRITRALFCDGGQNMMAQGRSLGFDTGEWYAVTGGDATACYSAAKCREAVRQFVYIRPDHFVIYDRVTSVKPEQDKVFLLHTAGEPVFRDGCWYSEHGGGALFLRTILPGSVSAQVIGGAGREFVTGGENWEAPPDSRKYLDTGCAGRYRVEISVGKPSEKVRFLHVLQTARRGGGTMTPVEKVRTEKCDGVRFRTAEGLTCEVMFNREGNIGGRLLIRRGNETLADKPLLAEQPVGPVQKHPPVWSHRRPVYPALVRAASPGGVDLAGGDKAYNIRREAGKIGFELPCAPGINRTAFSLVSPADGVIEADFLAPALEEEGRKLPSNIRIIQLFLDGKPQFAKHSIVSADLFKRVKIPCRGGKPVALDLVYQASDADPFIPAESKPVRRPLYPVLIRVSSPGGVDLAEAGTAVNIRRDGKKIDFALPCFPGINRPAFTLRPSADGVIEAEFSAPALKEGAKLPSNIRIIQLFLDGKPQFAEHVVVSAEVSRRVKIPCRRGKTVAVELVCRTTDAAPGAPETGRRDRTPREREKQKEGK